MSGKSGNEGSRVNCTSGTERCWDNEDCPRDDCDGELQEQDRFNVMCLSCEEVFVHYRGGSLRWLEDERSETVAEIEIGTERKALKFDSGPSTTLAIAQKANSLAATIRYNDEKGISKGDEIDVLSTHTGEKIGVASVEYTETVPVQRALDVVHQRWAEYGITQPDTLVSRLNDYYDDVITRLTEVKVIILDPDLRSQDTGSERENQEESA